MANPPRGTQVSRLAGVALLVSGLVAIPMVALLVAMYAAFGVGAASTALTLGAWNDALAIPVYALALAAVPSLYTLVRSTGAVRSLVLALIGTAGLVATTALQWKLVTHELTFENEIGPVSIALLCVGIWIFGTGYLGRSLGILPNGVRNGALGAIYLGYPVWALAVGRRLLSDS